MKTALVDINIVMDVLLDREPHLKASANVLKSIEARQALGMLAAHAVTTIYYLLTKKMSERQATSITGALLSVFTIATVNQRVIRRALELPGDDFEDAVTAAAAEEAGCDYIVTRDPKGFRGSPIPAITPESAAHIFTLTSEG